MRRTRQASASPEKVRALPATNLHSTSARGWGIVPAMNRSATCLGAVRRERLPLALFAMLVLLVQVVAAPMAAYAAPAADRGTAIICLGGGGFAVGEAGGGAQDPAGHAPGGCVCGPVCLHVLTCGSGIIGAVPMNFVAVEHAEPAAEPRLARTAPAFPPDEAHLTARAIRGPPVSARTCVPA
jgi:hypothetical protein